MPTLKTHKGATRRFRVTGTGQLRHWRAGRRHLLTGKASRKTRPMRRAVDVAAVSQATLRRLLPSH